MELFLQNCELSSLEVCVERAGAGGPPDVRRLARPFLFIGRDPRNDIQLDDDEVSRRHAYLQAIGGRLYCVDLDSRTGVHWPDGPRAAGWVGWNEPLRVGRNLIRLSRPRKTALILRAASDAPAAAPEAVFEVDDGAAPARWRMREPFALAGGAAACKVRLRHADVSRFHCGLVRGPLGVWVVDLLSRGGTRVNGRPVPWGRLAEGDRLEIGPFTLRLLGDEPRPVGRAALPAPRSVAVAPPDPSLLLPVVNEFNRMQQQMLDQFHQTMLMMAEMFTTLHREQSSLVREELEEMRRLTRELHALQTEQARQAAPAVAAEPPAPAAAPNGAAPASAPPGPARKPGPAASPDVHEWLSRRIEQLQEERNSRWQRVLQFLTGGKGV